MSDLFNLEIVLSGSYSGWGKPLKKWNYEDESFHRQMKHRSYEDRTLGFDMTERLDSMP